jgi:hypothetical protein
MDKLKQNAFWIGLGGVGLVLLVLIFFLVWQPLSGIETTNQEITELKKQIEKEATRKPYVATKKYGAWLKAREAKDKDARDAIVGFYDTQGTGFDEYFDGGTTPPETALFAARYKDEVEKLVNAYREKHKIAPNPDKPEENVPKVDVFTADQIDESKVPVAMKEFWIIQAVFEAVNKLELGGLKEISFAGRATADREAPLPYNKWVGVKVTLELPFSKLENLLTELYSSQRVPFQLEDLECRKIPESLSQFAAFKRTKKVKDIEGFSKVKYEEEVPEPPVHCDLGLSAFDWTGLPPDAPVDEGATDEGGADGEKADGKPKKKKKPK